MLNEQIGSYKITQLLGEGGMAHVYLAKKGTLGKQVALKVLKEDFISNRNVRGRFLSEARKMINLNHPNIVGVQDLIDDGDFVAIELEYIDGKTLKQHLHEKGALPDDEIQYLFKQMLDAISFVHEKGYVHRDIKPSNFMLSKNGIIKLTDFGIAKNGDDTNIDYTGTGTGMQMGTPKYMSPEQVRNTKDVDYRSDIYSLGVVLWEMVTGKVPYDIKTESTFDVFEKIVHQDLAHTGTRWDSVIKKATLKDVGKRKINLDVGTKDKDKKRPLVFTKNQKSILWIFAALLLIGIVYWAQDDTTEEIVLAEENIIPQWKTDFEQQWTEALDNETNLEPKENLDAYTAILEPLPMDAMDEKNKVQHKINEYKAIITEVEKIAENKRIEENEERDRKRSEAENERLEVEATKQAEKKRIEEEKERERERKRITEENKKSGTFTDGRDNKTYKTIKIGNQVWMAENLAYKPTSGKYWAYNNDFSNVSQYGYLYDWETACKVCPNGWHLPSDAEWTRLTDYLGGENVAGTKMKSSSGWRANGNGSNASGFSGLTGGARVSSGRFSLIGSNGTWWSSTEGDSTNAWRRLLFYSDGNVGRYSQNKQNGYSVRCLRD